MLDNPIRTGLKRQRATTGQEGAQPAATKKKKKNSSPLYPAKGVASNFTLQQDRKGRVNVKLMCRKYQTIPATKVKPVLTDTVKAVTAKKRFGFSRSGAFGRVVSAISTLPQNAPKFVVKYNTDDYFAKAFVKEAKLQFRFKHPAILECPGYASSPKKTYLILPRLKMSLDDCFEKGLPLNTPERFSLAKDIAEGLNYLHLQRYVHRDLSPRNILLDSNGHGYIADFGQTQKRWEENPHRHIRSRDNAYNFRGIDLNRKLLPADLRFSPERFYGDKVRYRNDIYSWGLIVYSLLYGEFIWNSWTNHPRCKLHFCEDNSCPHLLKSDNSTKPLRSFTSKRGMRRIDSALRPLTRTQESVLLKALDLAKKCVSLTPSGRPKSVWRALKEFKVIEQEFNELPASPKRKLR